MIVKSRITICGIPVDSLTMKETIEKIDNSIICKAKIHHVVINAAKLVNAQKDFKLRHAISECDIINADGQSIVWASKLLGRPLPERVAGIDLMEEVVKLASLRGYRIFLLGATEKVVGRVAEVYKTKYHNDIVAGYQDGYFLESEERLIAERIRTSKADILFVAMSSPRKEIFLSKYKMELDLPFIMGVGGSFDVVAGKTKRAPKWMQVYGLEWFYRVLQEPRRMWRRYMFTNASFVFIISKEIFNSLLERLNTKFF